MTTPPPPPPKKKKDINRILRGASREIRDLLRIAHDQEFRVALTRSDHFSVTTPARFKRQVTVFAPKTPSDTRGLHRVRRKLRHLGVDIPHS